MKNLILGIATARKPNLVDNLIMQEGAIYTLLGNIIPESIRKSGVDGDAIIDTNPIKLSIFKVISLCVTCIFHRRIVINSYYLGPWFSSLGHFLIESITRINSKMLSQKAKWVFHTMDGSPLAPTNLSLSREITIYNRSEKRSNLITYR